MIGAFVPWSHYKNSPGYLIDGSGCHIWIGARSGNGYAVARVAGRNVPVHRVRYEREVGPIPDGMEMDHFVCDNGPGGCCNPFHVRPVTRRENLLRGKRHTGNAHRTHCKRGHPLTWMTKQDRWWCKECHRDVVRRHDAKRRHGEVVAKAMNRVPQPRREGGMFT